MANTSIGGLMAALRKASGMTQRDLAERLNVSDKTISRWERDEGAPDLSLIPVIAELFGVTCDELLRGERKPVQAREETAGENAVTAKGEKAVKRLLRVTQSQYSTRTMITIAIASVGVIAALVANSFHRAQLGFWLSCLFGVAAVLSQAIFLNRALLAISAEELPENEVMRTKRQIIVTASRVFCVVAVLLAAMLPMLIIVPGSYYGLSGGEWCILSALFAAIAWFLWVFIHDAVMLSLMKHGCIRLPSNKEEAFRRNVRLKRESALVLSVLLGVTGTVHGLLSNIMTAHRMAEPIEFTDYQSFADFMAEDHGDEIFSDGAEVQITPIEVITNEDAYKRELKLSDGTVVLEYEDRNRDVVGLSYAERDGSVLPIYVITDDALITAGERIARRNVIFCVLYAAEAAAAFALYWKRRVR